MSPVVIRHTKLPQVPSESHRPDEKKTKLTVSRIQTPNHSNKIKRRETYFCWEFSVWSISLWRLRKLLRSLLRLNHSSRWSKRHPTHIFPDNIVYTSHNVRWRNLIVACDFFISHIPKNVEPNRSKFWNRTGSELKPVSKHWTLVKLARVRNIRRTLWSLKIDLRYPFGFSLDLCFLSFQNKRFKFYSDIYNFQFGFGVYI